MPKFNAKKINAALEKAFLAINNKQCASSGAAFEKDALKILVDYLKRLGFVEVGASEFKKNYEPYKTRTGQGIYFFRDVQHSVKAQADLLIVEKPNGSQQWPDALVIANGVGLPIEFKSNKNDFIFWNGGMPRENCLYLFNCSGIGQTTFFLGHDVLTSAVRKQLEATGAALQALAQNLNGAMTQAGNWTTYSRASYQSKEKYFANPALRARREKNVFRFLRKLTWLKQSF